MVCGWCVGLSTEASAIVAGRSSRAAASERGSERLFEASNLEITSAKALLLRNTTYYILIGASGEFNKCKQLSVRYA